MSEYTNILVDVIPTTAEIGGVEYEVKTDFRTVILFELMMDEPDMPDEEKVYNALDLFFGEKIPPDFEAAVNWIIWFYRCGKERRQESGNGAGKTSNNIYSFEHDDDYIYAAFLSQYGVDLQDIEYLHWWKFRAMFRSLTDDNEFVKIMGYRGVDISNDMSKEQQNFYRKMKKIHQLPIPQKEADRLAAIEEALTNGGDLSGLL